MSEPTDLTGAPSPRRRRRFGAVESPPPPTAGAQHLTSRAAELRRLDLLVHRRLDGLVGGEHLGRLPGPGTDRVGSRQYQPGDDARRIDWNLSARSLSPQVRTTDADRELETWIVADRSASLDFGTAECEKRELVTAAAAAFAALTTGGGNRLGVVITGGPALDRVEPASTRRAVLAVLARLHDTPRHAGGPGPGADLTGGLTQLERLHHRHGQVVVVSDFLDPADWSAPLHRLSLRHQVIAVQVTDPRERELPAVGMLTVIDTETGRTMHVQTNRGELRRRYAEVAEARQQDIAHRIFAAGAEHVVLSTDTDWLTDIARFITARRARRATRLAPVLAGVAALQGGIR